MPPERKRCFECGASYPPDARRCEDDQIALWPDTVNGVWRIEGILASRPGGATCAAYHLNNGARVAVDLVRGMPGPDPAALKALTQEIQALRLLDHPNTLRLVEEGVDRSHHEPENGDGIHYLVTDLGSARPLPDLVEEWHRASGTANGAGSGAIAIPLAALAQVGRQILGLLSAAHRLGLAHGGLTMAHIYVASEEDLLGSLSRSGSIRLHGLRALGLGTALREAIAADLNAVVAVLFELIVGTPLPEPSAKPPKLPAEVDGKLAQFILRGLGVNRAVRFTNADDMLRALVVASPPAPAEVTAEALQILNRTDPQAMRGAASSPDLGIKVAPIDSGPVVPPALPRLSGSHEVLPPSPLGSLPGSDSGVRSRFSGELKQVSFRDLVDQKDAKPGRQETLARARRVSSSSMKLSALPPPNYSDDTPPPPKKYGPPVEVMSSGEHASLEPTADLQALPVDFASAISGPVAIGSSLRTGRSEISLPPQPSLPPEAALAPRSPPPKPIEATKSNPPRPLPITVPIAAPLPAAPPIMPLPAPEPETVSDDAIDPLGITGQGPIPSAVLSAAAQRYHQEKAARALELVNSMAPKESPAPSTELAPPNKKPIWLFVLIGVVLIAALVGLLLRN